MDIYLVHLEAAPAKGSKEYDEIGGADVDIFVKAISEFEAETIAIDSLINRSWVVKERKFVLKMTPEQVRKLDIQGQSTYHLAKEDGISYFFAAWPVQDRNDNIIEVRELGEEDKSKN